MSECRSRMEDYLEARVLAHLGLGADPGPIPAAASGSVRQLLTQLAPAGRGAPPTPLLALDTSPTADPAVRRAAVDRRLASVDASALAAGFLERRRTGDPWWEWGRPFPLTAGTRSWLLRCGGPVEPVDGLLRRWAGAGRDEEVTTPAFRTALREGRHGPAVALPSADALLRILVPRLRRGRPAAPGAPGHARTEGLDERRGRTGTGTRPQCARPVHHPRRARTRPPPP